MFRPFPRLKVGLQRIMRPEPDFSDPSAFPEIRMGYYRADPDSVRRILDVNWSAHASSRREAWTKWNHFSLENGLQPLWKEPHPESCPWVMPVYASSLEDRLHWLRWSRNNNIDFFPWPALPKFVLQSPSSAVDRWHNLMCFPLHQSPRRFQIDKKVYVTTN